MGEQKVEWAVGRHCLVKTLWGWRQAFGREMDGYPCWIVPEDRDDGTTRERVIPAAFAKTATMPGQCLGCLTIEMHAEGCPVAENIARGVWLWLAPFVRQDPPSGAPDEGEVFQVYEHGLSQMIDISNPGMPPEWVVNAADPGEDAPDPLALGWACLGPEGPTLAPWEAP